jgi:hypothetical protein
VPVTVLKTRHVHVERDSVKRYVRLTRTAEKYDSIAQAVDTYTLVNAALDKLGRRDWGFLVDSRLAPLRNDATFEAAVRGPRSRTTIGFPRTAVVLRTAVGISQMARVVREDGAEMLVTLDEAEAVQHVTSWAKRFDQARVSAR